MDFYLVALVRNASELRREMLILRRLVIVDHAAMSGFAAVDYVA